MTFNDSHPLCDDKRGDAAVFAAAVAAIPDLTAAKAYVGGKRCWVITDGKAGDEAQCLGVAERLGLVADVRRVKPRAPFVWLMPYGPIDPAEAPSRPGSPLAPPFPDLAIASGRRAVAALRTLRKASALRTFTVFLKDPRTGAATADVIWVPSHDRLRGNNVLTTLTSPHRLSLERLTEAGFNPPFHRPVNRPMIGVLLGGDSQHHRFTHADIEDLVQKLSALAKIGMLVVTPSRRTPERLADAVAGLCREGGGHFWDGTGENPYLAILALSDHLVVTADSVNMLGEAASTGKPMHLFTPSGGHTKISSFVKGLFDHGAVHPLGETLETWWYPPLDATPDIAIAIARAMYCREIGFPESSGILEQN